MYQTDPHIKNTTPGPIYTSKIESYRTSNNIVDKRMTSLVDSELLQMHPSKRDNPSLLVKRISEKENIGIKADLKREGEKKMSPFNTSHGIQQKVPMNLIQPKLTVEDEYPESYVKKQISGRRRGKDKSEELSNKKRLNWVAGLLGMLSPHFKTENSGEVKSKGKTEPELVKGDKAIASCGMQILTRDTSVTDWKILVADHLSPHTSGKRHSILINSPVEPVNFGAHDTKGEKQDYNKAQLILGHEMCGHAALMELKAHPEGSRAVTNVHDPTVKIENEIAKEQGVGKERMRGMAKDGVHRGESFGKMVIDRFELNKGSVYGLPKSEQNKFRMLADMIRSYDMFVEIRGHSDNAGSEFAKQEVSDRRARLAQKFLMNMGVSLNAFVWTSETDYVRVPRFLRKGLSDKEPPENVDPLQQDKYRRVEVIIASYPWALSEMPPGISEKKKKKMELKSKETDTFKKPDSVEDLKKNGTPCEKLLIEKAYS